LFLSEAIERIVEDSNEAPWPCGLQSLERIAIGVRTGALPDPDQYDNPDTVVLPLFELPNLKDLYVRNCEWTGGHDMDGESEDDGYI